MFPPFFEKLIVLFALYAIIDISGVIFMTDKEIALELTKAYLNHKNTQIEAKHTHTDMDVEYVKDTYKGFYDIVSKVDAK